MISNSTCRTAEMQHVLVKFYSPKGLGGYVDERAQVLFGGELLSMDRLQKLPQVALELVQLILLQSRKTAILEQKSLQLNHFLLVLPIEVTQLATFCNQPPFFEQAVAVHLGEPRREVTFFLVLLLHKCGQLVSRYPLGFCDFRRDSNVIQSFFFEFAKEHIVDLIFPKAFNFPRFLLVINLTHEIKGQMRDLKGQLSHKRTMQCVSDGFLCELLIRQLDHVGMRAAGVGPAQRKGLLIGRSFLQKKFIFAVKDEDAECAMWKRFLCPQVAVGVGLPFIDWSDEMVISIDLNQLIQQHSVFSFSEHHLLYIILQFLLQFTKSPIWPLPIFLSSNQPKVLNKVYLCNNIFISMNQAWERSLKFHFKHLYYGQSQIDIDQLHRALSLMPECEKNRFPTHAIRNRIGDDEDSQDKATFEDLSDRIQRTLKDPRDSLFIDAYFDLVDQDGDGFINYDELTRIARQLSRDCMPQTAFLVMTEKLSQDGTKFSKSECIDILKAYI